MVGGAAVEVGMSYHSVFSILVFYRNPNSIERRMYEDSIDAPNLITPLPWNASVTPITAVDYGPRFGNTSVFAIGVDSTNVSRYYWRGAATKPDGCPPPDDIKFAFIPDSGGMLAYRGYDGAAWDLLYNVSSHQMRCVVNKTASYPTDGGTRPIRIFSVTSQFGCFWYSVWKQNRTYVDSPECGVRHVPILSGDEPVASVFAPAVMADDSERLFLLTGDPSPVSKNSLYNAAAQTRRSYAGKVLEISKAGQVVVRAGGLREPGTACAVNDYVLFSDRNVLNDELNTIDLDSIEEFDFNYGWPIMDGLDGLTVFTGPKPFSRNYAWPIEVIPLAYSAENDILGTAQYAIGALGILLAVLLAYLCSSLSRPNKVVIGWSIVFAALMVLQIPCIVSVPGYNATASTAGVVQSGFFHANPWLGAFLCLSILALLALASAVFVSWNEAAAISAVAAGLVIMQVIVLAGGVRHPWKVGWEGLVVAAVLTVVAAALIEQAFKRPPQYENL